MQELLADPDDPTLLQKVQEYTENFAAGKGFSIVAGEVRSLASKSAEAVQDTSVLIDRSVQAVKSGTESTNQAVSAMRIVTDCIQSIKTLMGEISLASSRQAEMITSVGDGIRDISRVVQANSAAAEESAVISKELSNQANALNDLLKQFRISAR